MQHHLGQNTALIARQAFVQPAVNDFEEVEIGLVAVDDRCARVDIRFCRVWLDQVLTEAVDGRAGDFVNRRAGRHQILALCRRQSLRQTGAELRCDMAGGEIFNEIPNPQEELTGRQFGKRDCRDGTWRDTLRQHDSDPAGHHGGLARSRAGLYQDRPVVTADSVMPGAIIVQNFHIAHHSTSQIGATALRRSVAAACLRLQ